MGIYRWLDLQHPFVRFGLKLFFKLLAIAFLILGFILAIFASVALASLFHPLAVGIDLSLIGTGLGGALGAFIALIGASFLWSCSYQRSPVSLTGKALASDTLGETFKVRFYRYHWGESPMGDGTLQFTPKGLLLTSERFRYHLFLQLSLFVVLFMLCYTFLGELGIFLTLLCFELVERFFKKPKQYLIPFTELKLYWKSPYYAIFKSQVPPVQIDFSLAEGDWQRFEHELELHAFYLASDSHLARA
jgi:hypothetical protein